MPGFLDKPQRPFSAEAMVAMIDASDRGLDAEAQLRAALAAENRAYNERCEPIVALLSRIMAAKPKPIFYSIDLIDPPVLAKFRKTIPPEWLKDAHTGAVEEVAAFREEIGFGQREDQKTDLDQMRIKGWKSTREDGQGLSDEEKRKRLRDADQKTTPETLEEEEQRLCARLIEIESQRPSYTEKFQQYMESQKTEPSERDSESQP